MHAALVWPRQCLTWAGRDGRRAALAPVGGQRRGGGVSGDTVGLRGADAVLAVTWDERMVGAICVACVSAAGVAHDVIEAQ